MLSEAVIDTLKKYVPEENIHVGEPMKYHTTFRVGGPADCLVDMENVEQLRKIRHYLRLIDIPYFVLGNGSNVLVGDKGYRGIILRVGDKMSNILVEGDTLTAQAGALMSKVAQAACAHSLKGFEFASGIPGTIGGGVAMNAGAFDGELQQVVTKVEVLDKDGNVMELSNDSMEFGYRTSVVKCHPFIVTEVTLKLERGNQDEIRQLMEELAIKRKEKQPLEYPSAGSTFKRPGGHYAGELIMHAGMRGYRAGGAGVSNKHCGFVVNLGHACAADVLDVIQEVRERVSEKFQVDLEPEVVMLGDF